MRVFVIAVMVAAIAASCGTSWAAFVAQPTEDNQTYDYTWEGCTMAEALQALYDQSKTPYVALLTDSTTAPASKPFKTLPKMLPSAIAGTWNRDTASTGGVTVIRPSRLAGMRSAMDLVGRQLVTSLSDEQWRKHAETGGLAWTELTDEQRECARYLAKFWRNQAQFPEPELTRRLGQSKLIVALHPNISLHYGDSTCGFYCDTSASKKLWAPWAPGQMEASKLAKAAQTEPGPDVPGDSSMCELAGVYALQSLMNEIAGGSETQVTCTPRAADMKISAYCSVTRAALARILATATGLEWQSNRGQWVLDNINPAELQKTAGTGTSADYTAAADKLKPALRKVAASGNLVFVADEPWMDPALRRAMLAGEKVEFAYLAPDQQSSLQSAWRQTRTAYKREDVWPEDPAELELNWNPNLKIYIATDNAILYSEWLSLR